MFQYGNHESISDNRRPRSLNRMYEGRMYVSETSFPQWAPQTPSSVYQKHTGNTIAPGLYALTQFLCQQFRRKADVEGDLRIAPCIVGGEYDENAGSRFVAFPGSLIAPNGSGKRLCRA